jgi:hypothetical protein
VASSSITPNVICFIHSSLPDAGVKFRPRWKRELPVEE